MKLIRDRTPDLERGSTRTAIDDTEFELLLRMKLMEEAAEVSASTSDEEMTLELADLFETMSTLAEVKGISWDKIREVMREKYNRKGGYEGRLVLTHDPLENKIRATV